MRNSQLKKVSLIFAAVLIVELLISCNHSLEGTMGPRPYDQANAPATSKSVVVRVNPQNPSVAEYINLDAAPAQQNFEQFTSTQQNWQSVSHSQVISGSQGYPAAQTGAYFVQQPTKGQQNAVAGYFRGNNYGCGYCSSYPNYGGYGSYNYNHYYYPNSGVNYGSYNYLPTYYSNYSYWYYQPTFYYPSYNYNYYIYSSWW